LNPEFFEDFSKSKEELSIKEAMNNGEHKKALVIYQKLIKEKVIDEGEVNVETAAMYEDVAGLYSVLGNKVEEKNYYLKSLNIKKQLKKNDIFGFARTYYKLGLIAEEEGEYDQAQMHYEDSLSKRLGDHDKIKEEDVGMINGMHQTRLNYIRLNNEATITTLKKLGAIHNIKKEYAIAKEYYVKALTASKLTFGEDDVETLKINGLIKGLEL
jgi:tetratricopeptide (TPR) repeat protein